MAFNLYYFHLFFSLRFFEATDWELPLTFTNVLETFDSVQQTFLTLVFWKATSKVAKGFPNILETSNFCSFLFLQFSKLSAMTHFSKMLVVCILK